MLPRSGSSYDSQTGAEFHAVRDSAGNLVDSASGNPKVSFEATSYAGENTPSYYKRLRKGELLPATSWSQGKVEGNWSGSHHRYDNASGYTMFTESNWSHPATLVPWEMSLTELSNYGAGYDSAAQVQRAAASIYAQGHDSLTFLAELHKVARMFRQLRANLAKLLKGKNLASSWLEYRYGWRLLYYDIIDIQKAAANLESTRKRFTQRSGTTASDTYVTSGIYNSGYLDFTVTLTTKVDISIRGTVTADIEPPNFRFNPINTTWELVTFSFIIDWILDIGTWLESLSFLSLATNYTAAGGLKIKATRTGAISYAWKGDNSGTVSFTSTSRGEMVTRVPSSVSQVPQFGIDISVPKVIDLIALVVTGKSGR